MRAADRGRPTSRRDVAFLVVLVCLLFTVSGSVGLVYEVAWKHIFTVVFGSTTYAVSVVISVFMAGLALGSFAFGRLADRTRRHLLIYALLEAGIALSGLLVPAALGRAESLYGPLFRATERPALLTAVQVLVSAGILLVPTFLMGGTLPVLSRFMASARGQVGSAVGILYGLNTLGAAGGAFLCGFVLIQALGTVKTVYLAAAANLVLSVTFLLLDRVYGPVAAAVEEGAPEGPEGALDGLHRAVLVGAVALSGFVSFSYEVLWTRALSFRLGASVYAFSIMLTTFLLGLGLGGAAVGLLKRTRAKAHYWRVYGWLEAGVGLCGLVGILLFFPLGYGYESFTGRILSRAAAAAIVMLVPTALMGAAFPIACHLWAAGVRQTGSSVGRVYLANTVGCVAGALLTGFWLVRWLGTQRALTAASFLMVAGAGVILACRPGGGSAPGRSMVRRLRPAAAVWAVALLTWALTPSGYLVNYFVRNQPGAVSNPGRKVTLLGHAEGVEGVMVACRWDDSYKTIAAGSTDVAGTSYILRNTQKLQAHIPMLIHPNPKEVCQVGFGSGETARIFASYDVDRFDCVEISSDMLKLADEYFQDINGGVVHWPNFNAIVMDAAAYLRYTDRKYDVIANDATWPSQAGPAMLFTLEYFQNGRDHLKPGGIMTSWLPLDMPQQDVKTVLKTFHRVFPYVYVWSALSHENKHGLIAGSDQPLRIEAARFLERFERFAREDLELVHLQDPAVFLACHLGKVEAEGPDLADAPLSTDSLPSLRFMYSRMYGEADMLADAYKLLRAHRDSILEHLTGWEAVAEADVLKAKVRRLDKANDLILQALSRPPGEEQARDRELNAALDLAPEHPAVALLAERRRALAGLTPEQIRALPLPELRNTARRLVRQGLYETALVALSEWTARQPDSAEPYTALGSCYLLMRKPTDAVAPLTMAVKVDPSAADALFSLGVALVQTNRPRESLPHLERAASLASSPAEAYAYLGTAHWLAGNVLEAYNNLVRAVSLNPNLPEARRNLGTVLFEMGRYRDAIAQLEKSLELGLTSALTHRMLGEAYRKVGDDAAAARHLKEAERLGGAAPAAVRPSTSPPAAP